MRGRGAWIAAALVLVVCASLASAQALADEKVARACPRACTRAVCRIRQGQAAAAADRRRAAAAGGTAQRAGGTAQRAQAPA